MRFFRLFLFILFFGIPVLVFAQKPGSEVIEDPFLRIEIPANSDNETYRVVPCGAHGVLVFFRSIETTEEAMVKWYFSWYDSVFAQVWIKAFPLPEDHNFKTFQLFNDTLALLFVQTGKSRQEGVQFEILRIGFLTGSFILNQGLLPEKGQIDAFGIQKGQAWFGININEGVGQIGHLRLSSGALKLFPVGIGKEIHIDWLSPDGLGDHLSVMVSRTVSKKSMEYFFVDYDTTGKIRGEKAIQIENPLIRLTNFQYYETSSGNGMIFGSYGQQDASNRGTKMANEALAGLFSLPIVQNQMRPILFHNFLELKSAGSLINEKEMFNLRKKASKKNQDIQAFSIGVPVLMHAVVPWKGLFILISETYSPQYHSESFSEFDFYGRPYSNSYSVFDGYRFLNAIVTAFDPEGKLVWENVLEIRNLVSFELNPQVTAFFSGDEMVLCYMSEGKIGSKIIHHEKVVEKVDFATLELRYPGDRLLSESKGRMVPWYGNFFLVYGYQEIKNISLPGNNKRMVFFISKVKFEK